MKRKIFTFLLSAFLGTIAMAEAPKGIVKKASVAPVIDGVKDAVWDEANVYNIALPFTGTTPTVGEEGTTTWRGLFTDDGIYLLVEVNDDDFFAGYMVQKSDTWNYDGIELYFNVNTILVDGASIGGHGGGQAGKYQVAPAFTADNIGGLLLSGNDGQAAFMVTAPTYLAEYFVPFSRFKDKDGADYDITKPMGFDVTVNDGDSAAPGTRQRMVWANTGGLSESWNNMDDCGSITFSDWNGGVIAKADAAPEVDGVVDDVWANAPAFNIDKPFQAETPTLGDPGQTTWQGLWTEDGVYLLLKVTDNEFYPAYKNSASDNWMYDKPEIYFDVNAEKKDGKGGKNSGDGHIQVGPGIEEAKIDGTLVTDNDGTHAFKVTDPNYVAEYFIPYTRLVDGAGNEVNKAIPMGFDVTIIDGESAAPGVRQRAVWSNDGKGPAAAESWANMDDCGLVKFQDAVMASDVESITVTGGTITTDGGTLQMVATVEPADANQNVKWVVENQTGRATISPKGVLTGVVDGTVLVKAIAKDGTEVEGKTTVTISGQIVEVKDINIIKNGNFDQGATGNQDWYGGAVLDGVMTVECTVKTNIWDTMIGQASIPVADAETPYTLKFKAWASEDMSCPMLFEDRSNGNNKGQTSLVEYRDNGYGKWDVPVTTEPKWYTVDVVFSSWVENSNFEFNWQFGLDNGTFYMDSVVMYKDADFQLVNSAKTLSNVNKVKLYPNPVQNELIVSKIAVANSKVSVYNAVGQKLIEKTANGTQAKFDVANLRKGMYFVRFSDGTSEKFIKQ
jgi:hypothetical protein